MKRSRPPPIEKLFNEPPSVPAENGSRGNPHVTLEQFYYNIRRLNYEPH